MSREAVSIGRSTTLVGAAKSRGGMNLRRREALEGYICLLPWAFGFLLFIAGPMVASLLLSLTKYDIVHPPVFVGLANFRRAFAEDKLFWPSLGRTFYYAAVAVPTGQVISLLCATLLNQKLQGANLYRTLYFLPSLTPVVASALLWVWLLEPQRGLVNDVLRQVGIKGPGWFSTKEWAIPAMIMITLWHTAGGSRMMIYLAGLQGVPEELYEAAEVDGAGAWRRFLHVTIPMITPTIFLQLVIGIIGALRVFAHAFVATGGGPNYATWFYAIHIYNQAFVYFSLGYGSALAWIFFVIMATFTVLQFRASNLWVFYAGETKS